MYELDDAVYVIAIRSSAPKNGEEVRAALAALNKTIPAAGEDLIVFAAAHSYSDLSSRHHDALVTLGFDRSEANQIVTVVSGEPEGRS